MFLLACSAYAGAVAASPAHPQMRLGRWETTRGKRNVRNTRGGATSPGRDQGPWTSVSICSGGPLPGKSPPASSLDPRGCVIKSYEATNHTARIKTRCPFGDGWREEDSTITFSPVRVDFIKRSTVKASGVDSSFEEYRTSRWIGPCENPRATRR